MARKFVSAVVTACAASALAFAPASALGSQYPVPKPSGGSKGTKQTDKKVAQKIEHSTGSKIANGITVTFRFPSAGKVTITVKSGGQTLGSGTASSSKKGTKKVKITFTSAGKAYLESHAGAKATITTVFKPTKGKSSTSTTTVTIG